MSATLDVTTSRDERRRPTDLHLRAVLERLPVAVLRVEVNGTLMAVNQAGLGLLGADSLAQVLGTSFLAYLDDSLVAPCRRLLEDARQGLGGSLEIDLRGLTGTPHALEVHAVPHPGAPDATPSVMVTLRDVTRARQLAQVLEDTVARQTDADNRLQSALQDLQQQQSRYDALLTERQQSGQQVEAEHAGLRQRLTAAAEETTRAVARATEVERAMEDAQRGHEEARRAHESRTAELQARIESLVTAHGAHLADAESALAAARDAERAAQTAWTTEQSERLRAEVGRQHLVDAIARLAREAGVVGRTDPGDAGSANPTDANGHDVPAPHGPDTTQTSAW